jgi:hypothetical protein
MTATDPKQPFEMSQIEVLNRLPEEIASKTISPREIVLPRREALLAIDLIEEMGLHITGWEGWVRDPSGRVGHGSAPQGTVSLTDLSVADAAEFCRQTIPKEGDSWEAEYSDSGDTLFFCITVRTS